MPDTLPLLIELGTEELPIETLPELAQAFFDRMRATLQQHGILEDASAAQPLYTPRRLAMLFPKVRLQPTAQHLHIFGPSVQQGLDAKGQPTAALRGFAAKHKVAWETLEQRLDGKTTRFALTVQQPIIPTAERLPAWITEALQGVAVKKPMRWADTSFTFARPVHWLVVLLGDTIIPMELMGVHAGRQSHGHRFMHPAPVVLESANQYIEALFDAKVLVDPHARQTRIKEHATQAAKRIGGNVLIDSHTLSQVVHLTEWPCAITASFDADFLRIPQEVLMQTMQVHQKFFPVVDASGALAPHFIGIANIQSPHPELISQGYGRVITPRFADAQFFYEEDLRLGLHAMGEGLQHVTYQAQLGTIAEKVHRVESNAIDISDALGVAPALAQRAAQLCKNDLQSRLVGEFPELQGIAGRYYALAAKEPHDLATALDEVYAPRFAADAVARTPLGQVLAIADRLDTLAGGFFTGYKPSGKKDPFAMRRTALGLMRTLIHTSVDLDFSALLHTALTRVEHSITQTQRATLQKPPKKPAPTIENLRAEIQQFCLDRLYGYYTDSGIHVTCVHAATASAWLSIYDLDCRVRALDRFSRTPDASAVVALRKRIRNVLHKNASPVEIAPDATVLQEPAERALHSAYVEQAPQFLALMREKDYNCALEQCAKLQPFIDAFFDTVLIYCEEEELRIHRLALLYQLHRQFDAIAAIDQLTL